MYVKCVPFFYNGDIYNKINKMKKNKQSSTNSTKTNTRLGSEKSSVDKELEKRQLEEIKKRFSRFSGKSTPPEGWFEF